jgi:hypothetical protein
LNSAEYILLPQYNASFSTEFGLDFVHYFPTITSRDADDVAERNRNITMPADAFFPSMKRPFHRMVCFPGIPVAFMIMPSLAPLRPKSSIETGPAASIE